MDEPIVVVMLKTSAGPEGAFACNYVYEVPSNFAAQLIVAESARMATVAEIRKYEETGVHQSLPEAKGKHPPGR